MEDRLRRRISVTPEILSLDDNRVSNSSRRARNLVPGRLLLFLLFCGLCAAPPQVWAQTDTAVFAVVSEAPKDKTHVSAKALIDGALTDTKLLPSDTVMTNPIWRTLEICHAMKLEGSKSAEGFRVSSVRILDASMLPMTLQGFAGDCLIKKAVDIAPLVD
jgi:hypothetical protein